MQLGNYLDGRLEATQKECEAMEQRAMGYVDDGTMVQSFK